MEVGGEVGEVMAGGEVMEEGEEVMDTEGVATEGEGGTDTEGGEACTAAAVAGAGALGSPTEENGAGLSTMS